MEGLNKLNKVFQIFSKNLKEAAFSEQPLP
jgi:hypothetical protein